MAWCAAAHQDSGLAETTSQKHAHAHTHTHTPLRFKPTEAGHASLADFLGNLSILSDIRSMTRSSKRHREVS